LSFLDSLEIKYVACMKGLLVQDLDNLIKRVNIYYRMLREHI